MAETFLDKIQKFNPYHGRDGRFTSPGMATSFTIASNKYGMKNSLERAKEREKQRQVSLSIKSVEDKIRHQNYESAAIIDKNGKQLVFKDGESNQVAFNREETALMRGATLTHNHPQSTAFSPPDIQLFVQSSLAEIRATNREGQTYCLRRPKNFDYREMNYNRNYERENKFIDAYYKKRKTAVMKAQKTLDEKMYYKKVMSGEITQEQANRDMDKLVSKEMHKYLTKYAGTYGFEYKLEG